MIMPFHEYFSLPDRNTIARNGKYCTGVYRSRTQCMKEHNNITKIMEDFGIPGILTNTNPERIQNRST